MASMLAADSLKGLLAKGRGRLSALATGASAARRATSAAGGLGEDSAKARTGGYGRDSIVAASAVGMVAGVFLEKQTSVKDVRPAPPEDRQDESVRQFERGFRSCSCCEAPFLEVDARGSDAALAGASAPRSDERDCPAVVLKMRRLGMILPVGPDGKHVLGFGAGVWDLQEKLRRDFNRERRRVLDNSDVELTNWLGLKDAFVASAGSGAGLFPGGLAPPPLGTEIPPRFKPPSMGADHPADLRAGFAPGVPMGSIPAPPPQGAAVPGRRPRPSRRLNVVKSGTSATAYSKGYASMPCQAGACTHDYHR